MIRARTATSVELPVTGLWLIYGDGAATTPIVTVTQPGGATATPAVDADSYGCWRAEYVVSAPGRYIARAVTASDGAVDFTAFVTGAVAAGGMPTAGDVDEYLLSFSDHSWSPDDLGAALAAESDAQRRVCDVPAAYPLDLREALLRRTWRNLKMRGQPLLTIPGAEDGVAAVAPGADPEVRRLERPFRKLIGR